ncbi:phosphate acyltransferase [Ureaplasma ceti]|uniref:Phosphate acetyl/butaryl transferase domain-containing protein n=1 Tax=Ureaplasma ceti TaxID=3119530 RepID=A0ABP9U6L8_9BACT
MHKILVPEQSKEIQEALELAQTHQILATNKIELPVGWYETTVNNFSDTQKELIAKTQLNIDKDNLIFQAFVALNLGLYSGLLIGHEYTSKMVFLYTILFFSQENYLSSCFVTYHNEQLQIWTDCAFNIQPNAQQLNAIATNAVHFYQGLSNNEPSVAFLSYATLNSAGGAPVQLVKDALTEFQKTNNAIASFGPLQFDAVINTQVWAKKVGSTNTLTPNVLVFPDLNSGNIAYKVANQLAYQEFYGPFVLGPSHLVCDLSRSATSSEIFETLSLMQKMLSK